VNLHVTPERFALLDRGWLVVRPEGFKLAGGFTYEFPPDSLSALVGKACATCSGTGSWGVRTPPVPGERVACEHCHGTGSELLTVTTECCHNVATCRDFSREHCTWRTDGTGNGTRSTLVRLTGEAVPIVGNDTLATDTYLTELISISDDTAWHWPAGCDDAQDVGVTDLGPDPASLVGCWAFPVEVVA
jgi:hypothetical protein